MIEVVGVVWFSGSGSGGGAGGRVVCESRVHFLLEPYLCVSIFS